MRRVLTRVIAAAATAGALLVTTALPAQAATGDDTLWYVDAFHLHDAHDAGFTGKGVTVGVIDTAINPDIPEFTGADVSVHEPSFCGDANGKALSATSTTTNAVHGTNVAAYVVGNGKGSNGAPGITGSAPGAKVIFYSASFHDAATDEPFATDKSTCEPLADGSPNGLKGAFDQAVADGVDIISISLGGTITADTIDGITRAENAGIVIVAALPNVAGEPSWPAGANGVVAVQAIGADGAAQQTDGVANSFDKVTVSNAGLNLLIEGTQGDWTKQGTANGTSIATPLTAGFLADVKQKFPKATGNQLIQTLIHNTGAGNPDLTVDNTYGYGIASLSSMLKSDPTSYADVNPLVVDDPEIFPNAADLGVGASPTASPSATATAPAVKPGDDASSGLGAPMIIGIVILALLVLAGVIVLIVILSRRRNGVNPPSDQSQTGA